MASSGKKKPAEKKDTSKNNAGKNAAKTTKKTTVKPATKKPASFSRAPKKAEKKVTEKATKKKLADKKKPTEKKVTEKKVDKAVDNFAEFETLKISAPEAPEPKIILRDVAEDKLIKEEARTEETPEEVVEKALDKAEREPEPEVVMPEPKIDMVRVKEQVKAKNATRVRMPESRPKVSASEIKNHEIEKAIRNASELPETDKNSRRKNKVSHEFGWQRVVLALCCAATLVFAIAYFVNLTSADISLKVAAMQSGIDASYPSYVPRGYSLSDVTSSSGKVTMNFKSDEGSFGISEESSTWDSNALLNNYIKENYNENYTVVREQGLTLYMGNDWEAWVNGGMLYKLTVKSGTLTKKQMKSIATSL